MKNLKLSLIAIFFFIPISLFANEGMWFLMHIERLNHRDMQKMGLQLTPEEIYSINNQSLKDAIVQFNGGCTASIISSNGLVLTNHHCGYNAIAELSTAEQNHLKNGFWAKSFDEELKPQSLYVRYFVRMDDVSERILSQVNNSMSEKEREAAINKEIAKIQSENDEGGKYTVSVRSFFQGNEFYYFVYQDYTDVRLVGTPAESIGKYGGDTDNWEWPRHTGDFSLFRVYGDANGQPASYSTENVPLKSNYHLPVNISGVKENDFAMILGYPGRTNRWMPAEGIEQNVKYAYPAWVEGSKLSMDVMKKYMDEDESINLMYASQYAGIANYWKNRQGMIDALTKHGTAETKRKTESKFNKWAQKADNIGTYGNVINDINNYYALTNEKAQHDNYLLSLLRSSKFSVLPYRLGSGFENYANANEAKRQELLPRLKAFINGAYTDYHLPLEKEVLAEQLKLYTSKSNYGLPDLLSEMSGANFETYVESIFNLSMFSSKEGAMAFLDYPDPEILANDPLYKLSSALLTKYREQPEALEQPLNDYQRSYRLLVNGLKESGISKIQYPDANSTLRLTYGKVRALPKDSRNDAAVNNYTTFKGVLNKYVPNDDEFDLPKDMLNVNKGKDYGRYANENGELSVNFLTDNDITGGNSGSPVLNGKGELIGLAFDGNIEAMAGDVIFDKDLQRTINVDIRYVLWLIDNYSNAKNIVDELTIVTK
ncbi:S46 family peptidase [Psychroserpens sp.]|uniref:S46 family peptidase n=1 Tax=Psychroserpens sp. TaxID=2020870 RepID=UPI001B1A4F8A|nr:S46 family peptidase [Psychroserpens sp.]MBO6607641.1 S46 family peptidase [Psychroserpens sp.]MBO6631416.1 S46 family peptidase [Psychroserpens sp.]MBO6655047.1 S46 family peptidase [Psychroserpens sp.]MBO6683148.1 S46 family peptidase [Psychroserpens sp.]MBO6749673.1 S46 family peptidase [Psychroserpens sp.]